jgi:Fe2+ transport system protein FeoA
MFGGKMKLFCGLAKRKFCHRRGREQKGLQKGNTYIITGYRGLNEEYRKKLLNLGLLRGEKFHVMGKAPMGDPIEIKINGYRLSLRAEEADELITEKIENEK